MRKQRQRDRARGVVLGHRQRRSAFGVDRELVHGWVVDAGLHAALGERVPKALTVDLGLDREYLDFLAATLPEGLSGVLRD